MTSPERPTCSPNNGTQTGLTLTDRHIADERALVGALELAADEEEPAFDLYGPDGLARFGLGGSGGGSGGGQDCDPISPVPLPAAGWLMMAGLGGLAALGRRRAKG